MPVEMRAALHSASSRSPPRPPGAGFSKSSQNAGLSKPHAPAGGRPPSPGMGSGTDDDVPPVLELPPPPLATTLAPDAPALELCVPAVELDPAELDPAREPPA